MVKRLAVNEALFGGVYDATSSPTVTATCVREFWDYVRRKFGSVEEVVVLIIGNSDGSQREDATNSTDGVSRYVLGRNDNMGIGSPEERLVECLEIGLRFVEEKSGWKAPTWDVLRLPEEGNGAGSAGWPNEMLAGHSGDLRRRERSAVINNAVIRRTISEPKEQKGFWMGGELPYWHYLASQE